MGIIIECPKYGHWNAGSALVCRGLIRSGSKKGNPCDVRNLRRLPAKEYLIEYGSSDGKKIRERVGPNKLDAEYRLQEMQNQRNIRLVPKPARNPKEASFSQD